MDVLQYDASTSANIVQLIGHYQQEDLVALGRLTLALACGTMSALTRETITQVCLCLCLCLSTILAVE